MPNFLWCIFYLKLLNYKTSLYICRLICFLLEFLRHRSLVVSIHDSCQAKPSLIAIWEGIIILVVNNFPSEVNQTLCVFLHLTMVSVLDTLYASLCFSHVANSNFTVWIVCLNHFQWCRWRRVCFLSSRAECIIFDSVNITCLSWPLGRCVFSRSLFWMFLVSCIWIMPVFVCCVPDFVRKPPRTDCYYYCLYYYYYYC